MTRSARIDERPSASRIDDRRPAHISASLNPTIFGQQPPPVPSPAGFTATPPAVALLRTLAPMR